MTQSISNVHFPSLLACLIVQSTIADMNHCTLVALTSLIVSQITQIEYHLDPLIFEFFFSFCLPHQF